MKRLVICALATTVASGCGGGGGSSKFPARPEGCAVQVFQIAPPVKTENIGPVFARCDDRQAEKDCLRTLLDEVCKLGGDVVWWLDPQPVHEDDKLKYAGRAAHTVP